MTLRERERPCLEVTGIAKSYPGTTALSEIGLAIVAGEIHGVAGQNGAGKSTLIRILSGIEKPDAGWIAVDGMRVAFNTPQDAQRAQIYTVHQELSLMPLLSVAENIFMGDMPLKRGLSIDWRAIRRQAKASLHELGIDIDVRRPVASLPIGHQQMVEIAKAVRRDARILLLDEPTSTLPSHEVHQLFSLLRRLKERGIAIIYISHHLNEMFEICDQISVFRDGTKVSVLPARESEHEAILASMLGHSRNVADSVGGGEATMPRIGCGTVAEEAVMRVKGLRNTSLKGVDLELRRGEVLGISGLLGNGQNELANALFGATAATSSSFVVNGRDRRPRDPAEAIRLGIGLLPEDRKTQGLVLNMPVTSNVTMSSLRSFTKTGFLRRPLERRTTNQMREVLAIKTGSIQQAVVNLSGGNQQKVALAKWLVSGVKILVFAEPTRGVDVGAKLEIYQLIRDFVRDGGSVLLVTSEIDEAVMCDRVLVMQRGTIVGQVDRDQLEEQGEKSIIRLFS